MSPAEMHPEHLLDRERRGTLEPAERVELDAHAARCPACALERATAGDFASELEPEDGDAELIERALDAALDAAEAPAPRRGLRARALLLGAAAALLAAGAAAAWLAGARRPAPPVEAPRAPATAAPPAAEPARAAPVPAPTGSAAEPEPPAPPSAAPGTSRPAPGAAELFASANRARREGRDAEALRLYRELQHRHPDSREARASRITVGQMLLDRKDPKEALGQFDGYLEPGARGAVGEEALVGRAQALQKLGRVAEERAAWQELLASYPSSVHAARARQRLAVTAP